MIGWRLRSKMGRRTAFHKPPMFISRIFERCLPDSDSLFLRGDFEEIFQDIVAERGVFQGHVWYWAQLIVTLPKILVNVLYWRVAMFKNYVKVAVRNLLKQKFYSFINITGLAVGIACCLLILLYVRHELSYDRYHEKVDRLHRVTVSLRFGGTEGEAGVVGRPTAQALVDDYPEVETAVRVTETSNWFVRYGDKTFKETRLAFADHTLFEVFTIPLLKGYPATALKEPNTLVLSEAMAMKYFGHEDPLGKTLNLDGTKDYLITGVFENMPDNSHFHCDFFASFATVEERYSPIWLSFNLFTYIVLREGADAAALEDKFPEMVEKYCGPEFEMFANTTLEELVASGNYVRYHLQPVLDIHLHSRVDDEFEPNGDITVVYIFSAIALFILIIACVNFMNLSTARSANRAMEVGMRKVVGSFRSQLIVQFLSESFLMSAIALVMAIGLSAAVLPFFNNLAGIELNAAHLFSGALIFSFFLIIILVGVAAGVYPAFFLSSFRPVSVLKQGYGSGTGNRLIRRVLVIFQFVASTVLIIGTLVVLKQLHYIQNRKLGFEKERVILVHDAFILRDQSDAFKQEVVKHPGVINATLSSYLPVTSSRSSNVVFPEGKMTEETAPIQTWRGDHDFVDTFGLEILQGRDFSVSFSTDSSAVIINEATAKHFGWDEPLGKQLGMYVSNDSPVMEMFTVVGVVRDFHFESLRSRIGPWSLFLGRSTGFVAVRLETEGVSEVIRFIEEKWDLFTSSQPFEYSFLDDRFDAMYRAERRLGTIFEVFASLAIFVGCLGLLGLAAFSAEQKTKEIGIRKTLGATVPGIVFLISKEFGKLVIIAFIFAVPVSYYIMSRWLEDFAYRIEIGVLPFVLSGLISFVIALLIVSYQAVKAALRDPVDSLKYE